MSHHSFLLLHNELCNSMLNRDYFIYWTGLSVDGDIQGVQRLYGALSACMWPGMVMKSGETTTVPTPIDKKEGKV